MNTFSIAAEGEKLLSEYFKIAEYDVRWVPYAEDENFQYHYGDCKIFKNGGEVYAEVKAEKAQKYGNLFIETWSNKSIGREGWLYNLKHTHILYYIFLREQLIYVINFEKLRNFDLSKYPEKPQSKYEQDNDTWGRCVPIIDLKMAGVITAVRNMNEIRKAQ